MRGTPYSSKSALGLALLALGVSLVIAVQLVTAHGLPRLASAGELPWQTAVLLGLALLTTAGTISAAFTVALRPDAQRLSVTAASAALALALSLEATHTLAKLPSLYYFGVSCACHLVFTLAMTRLMNSLLDARGRWVPLLPALAAAAVALVGALGFVGQSWISLEKVSRTLVLVRDLALVVAPLAAAVTQLTQGVRRSPATQEDEARAQAASLRPAAEDRPPPGLATGLMGLGVVASLGFSLATGFFSESPETPGDLAASLAVFSWTWIGTLYLSLTDLARLTSQQRQGNVTAQLAPSSARRLLERHHADQSSWAATVGLKTSNFIIDHDPRGLLHAEVPASILQLRAEEIQRCVFEVLGPLHLHSSMVGHRIYGALDPERALRPCVDLLRMFACLYLDAGPLVERRIKGLTALLPIVDPGLAQVLKPREMATLMQRTHWFFHCDFGWIDQQLVHSPRVTRYDVNMTSLSAATRHSIASHLEQAGGVGNLVWLGQEARERLLQEAPTLRNIIEACPVGGGTGQDEHLMFVIRFEQLIPRLQCYFDLDTMRQALLDFEPSPESTRLFKLLELQIVKAENSDEILEALSSITSVPWRGFKEKDGALKLVLKGHERLAALLTGGRPLRESQEPAVRRAAERLIDAVGAIGYPSQLLHRAQLQKVALRDADLLREVALDPGHPRFAEAWLLLATMDYRRLSRDKRAKLLTFLQAVPRQALMARHRLVQIKVVDALSSIGLACPENEWPLLGATLAEVVEWFVSHEVEADVCGLLLDAQIFLTAQHGPRMRLDGGALQRLDSYFHRLADTLGSSHPKVVSIMSRWQDIRAKASGGTLVA